MAATFWLVELQTSASPLVQPGAVLKGSDGKMGATGHLPRKELADLQAYLQTL